MKGCRYRRILKDLLLAPKNSKWSQLAHLANADKEDNVDTTTLLIIIIIVLLVGGGGWYGRGRWF